MQKIFDVEVDIKKMTFQELKAARDKARVIKATYLLNHENEKAFWDIQNILLILNHEISVRSLTCHKHGVSVSA